jgi:hypothetical protein
MFLGGSMTRYSSRELILHNVHNLHSRYQASQLLINRR